MENLKIQKMLEMLENGELVRGSYQRTPSHDLKKSREIVGDILKNKFAGALTFSKNPENALPDPLRKLERHRALSESEVKRWMQPQET